MAWGTLELLRKYVSAGIRNPFAPFIFLSYRVPESSAEDPRYQKGWFDLLFVAYYIVFWSLIRQCITLYVCRPFARSLGLKKEAKIDRLGEQVYSILYAGLNGLWGIVSAHNRRRLHVTN